MSEAGAGSGLIDVVHRLPGKRVVVLGDVMLDRYVYGKVDRVSPEAPVPIMHFNGQDNRLGGAANVAADLAALGCEASMVGTCCDDDEAGRDLRKMLGELGVDTTALLHTPGRCTTSKVRMVGVIENRKGQLLRLDYEDVSPVDDAIGDALLERLAEQLKDADVLCIEDYNKGACSKRVCQGAIRLAKEAGVPVLVDPARIRDYAKYAGATLLKLNRPETRMATGLPVETDADVEAAATKLLGELNLEAIVVTVDKDGAFLATKDGPRQRVASKAR
ncbi:MAG: PfkB family carbohydrate kinase, partial [Planctomycetota bacterium]